MYRIQLYAAIFIAFATSLTVIPSSARACGGFFCTTVPIDQAAEQIVFRQGNGTVTAMVRITYSGNAEDFSWVVPVPDTPVISIGSDTTFNQLDFATRPVFQLEQEGSVCPQDEEVFNAESSGAGGGAGDSDGGAVTVEEELMIGPFNINIVSSDSPDDMAIWLQDNGYLLTDRGTDLIEPYVIAGMKFVAVKLRSGETSGSIQPIIMEYPSERPMIPIRLTAVAAEDDMGVLVWVINDQAGRAIPENYLHVVPNYARVDWFSGPFNAYGSYQSLITDAMNESGGQGFATDFAGTLDAQITNSLTGPESLEGPLVLLDSIADDADFLTEGMSISINPTAALANLQTNLPLPEGRDSSLYFSPEQLRAVYTLDELAGARLALRGYLESRELQPLRDSVALLPEGAYLTRLYTTLSADEMTLDPTFNYNASMPDQPRERNALLSASCADGTSNWKLILGAGTDRDGEVVADVTGQPLPFFNSIVSAPLNEQPAAFARQRTFSDAQPELLYQAPRTTVFIDEDGSIENGSSSALGADDNDDGFLGAGGPGLIVVICCWLLFRQLNGAQARTDT